MSSGELRAASSAKSSWAWRYPRAPTSSSDSAAAGTALEAGYDELFDAGGKLRPSWERVANLLEGLGLEELRHRWELARQLLREHGVSFDVCGDPQGVARP